ncbi:hypothetical protein H112_05940 [Trichophyton rubrum D6]|uniref:Uncharacterized protein n=3 Tax=Trichophyton TaxID=5550 RepID=F2SL64_TRIRC|nr:uncharacterized protein TERG_03646 [Trichophyton rubrum CBS 118892]EZF15188.1 hypothetical protein H100_05955 [Trichophyton rubrum MR850]EZF40022.1 hypothetical protein H102_05924 [Trichophyton rubrum CBS 100081]EZF50617.1 hypothetical protein H103_05950 [Trichophyton rubrum CBS 288.86]EZF82577.1 hypothetical protein H110_05946 [Trichophyton rubrum MR1448]EZF93244.1 hypothetical protein H113_05992 [Trichophyton rubrum MR1459]EZG04106.1 hypothetical protein H106_05788 [Trichophyton rubrum C
MVSRDNFELPALSRATSKRSRCSSRLAPEVSSHKSSSRPPPYLSAAGSEIGRRSSRSSRPRAESSGDDGVRMLPARPQRAHRSSHSRATQGDVPEIMNSRLRAEDRHSSRTPSHGAVHGPDYVPPRVPIPSLNRGPSILDRPPLPPGSSAWRRHGPIPWRVFLNGPPAEGQSWRTTPSNLDSRGQQLGQRTGQLTWGVSATPNYWGVHHDNPKSWIGGGSDSKCVCWWLVVAVILGTAVALGVYFGTKH